MESQKIISLLDSNDNESQKFATKRWYIINDQNTGNNAYGNGEDGTTIKFETKAIKPNFVPRVDITSYDVLIDGRNFYDQPINDSIRKYDELERSRLEKEIITRLDVY